MTISTPQKGTLMLSSRLFDTMKQAWWGDEKALMTVSESLSDW